MNRRVFLWGLQNACAASAVQRFRCCNAARKPANATVPIAGHASAGDFFIERVDPDDPAPYVSATVRAGSSVVEHVTFNHVVVGSIPTPLTTTQPSTFR
ncbi:hypothetical protein BOSEA31B_10085 [Hyphomicrobiales bacterium]|nr:hypothetical protein BOSEA31B_10085 [Hyphomicrobiales bacterium]CAH1701765.1 hypothetical protein BOSEA1005_21464 [Hyphomicrobiales bacterium]CAI0345921.1 hypothetical protein BO1005MUT1_470079 [Hyphomicrobiales bacterium]